MHGIGRARGLRIALRDGTIGLVLLHLPMRRAGLRFA
jgi:hypothetical protein